MDFHICFYLFSTHCVVVPQTESLHPSNRNLPRKSTPIGPGKYVLKRLKVAEDRNRCYSSKENAQHCSSSDLPVHDKSILYVLYTLLNYIQLCVLRLLRHHAWCYSSLSVHYTSPKYSLQRKPTLLTFGVEKYVV